MMIKRVIFKTLKTSLSNMGVTVPTLFKQYSDICEEGGVEFHGFNVDENFSDCIEWLYCCQHRSDKR